MISVESKEDLKDRFVSFSAELNQDPQTPEFIRLFRKNAADAFAYQGFPTTRNEEWRYTRVKPYLNTELQLLNKSGYTFNLTPSDLENLTVPKSGHLIVVENGFVNPLLSRIPKQNGLFIGNLLDGHDKTALSQSIGRFINNTDAPFAALNSALLQDGLFITVSDNCSISETVYVVYITDSRKGPVFCNPRLLCTAGKNSRIKLSEMNFSFGEKGFTNQVTEIHLEEGAQFHLYKVQQENKSSSNITYTQILQEKDSASSVHTISLSGALIRNDLHYLLHGRGCKAQMYGLYLAGERQHVDNHTFVDHASPGCYSNELYKGIIRERATAVFNGKILVRPDAQKTNAYQNNANILLSDEANIFTKPQLEIFADDVKCSHGATTGQIDAEALFYLRSRGLDETSARSLLVSAFANDVIATISEDNIRVFVSEAVTGLFLSK